MSSEDRCLSPAVFVECATISYLPFPLWIAVQRHPMIQSKYMVAHLLTSVKSPIFAIPTGDAS